jgi:hypothetical protein
MGYQDGMNSGSSTVYHYTVLGLGFGTRWAPYAELGDAHNIMGKA